MESPQYFPNLRVVAIMQDTDHSTQVWMVIQLAVLIAFWFKAPAQISRPRVSVWTLTWLVLRWCSLCSCLATASLIAAGSGLSVSGCCHTAAT